MTNQDNRLLTPEEISVYKLYGAKGFAGYDIDGLLKAQDAKTAPIAIRELLDYILCKLREIEKKHPEEEAQGWLGVLFDIVHVAGKEFECNGESDIRTISFEEGKREERERITEIYTRYREVLSPKELMAIMLDEQALRGEIE